MLRSHLTLLLALAFSASASAQVTTIGPFTGAQSEGFENGPQVIFLPCVPQRVFNNTADLCTPGNSGCHTTSGWGFYCSIYPHSGARLFGSAGGYAEYTFDTPVQRFGGYFGNHTPDPSFGTVILFDVNNNQLFSGPINTPNDCIWHWGGWDAGTTGGKIKRAAIYGAPQFGGGFELMDDMEYDLAGGTSPGTDMCLPGASGVLACPCSNPPSGIGSRGCDNSSATGGAELSSAGAASLAGDTVVFTTSDERPTATSIVLQGNALISSGIAFGQGVRCAGGGLKRLYAKTASGGSITAPQTGDPSVSARSAALGDPIAAGSNRWYSVYYRDPIVLGGCPATNTFNITQTQQITWAP
jgi:hypothetical protein